MSALSDLISKLCKSLVVQEKLLNAHGLKDHKITLVIRHPSDPQGFILTTRDDLDEVAKTIELAKEREGAGQCI